MRPAAMLFLPALTGCATIHDARSVPVFGRAAVDAPSCQVEILRGGDAPGAGAGDPPARREHLPQRGGGRATAAWGSLRDRRQSRAHRSRGLWPALLRHPVRRRVGSHAWQLISSIPACAHPAQSRRSRRPTGPARPRSLRPPSRGLIRPVRTPTDRTGAASSTAPVATDRGAGPPTRGCFRSRRAPLRCTSSR